MSTVESLREAYRRHLALPLLDLISRQERIWFAIYPPAQERRLRPRIRDFEHDTRQAGHGWALVDLTDAFATWMAAQEYREAYFEQPEDMTYALDEFKDYVVAELRKVLTAPASDGNTVVAVIGVASLFGLTRTSVVLDEVAPDIRGRLLVFFPGQRDGNNYRLMDARDGWNYLAVAIEAAEGG